MQVVARLKPSTKFYTPHIYSSVIHNLSSRIHNIFIFFSLHSFLQHFIVILLLLHLNIIFYSLRVPRSHIFFCFQTKVFLPVQIKNVFFFKVIIIIIIIFSQRKNSPQHPILQNTFLHAGSHCIKSHHSIAPYRFCKYTLYRIYLFANCRCNTYIIVFHPFFIFYSFIFFYCSFFGFFGIIWWERRRGLVDWWCSRMNEPYHTRFSFRNHRTLYMSSTSAIIIITWS